MANIKVENIRLEMLRHKVTGKEIAREAGLTECTVSRWLNDPDLPVYKRQLLFESVQAAARQKGATES